MYFDGKWRWKCPDEYKKNDGLITPAIAWCILKHIIITQAVGIECCLVAYRSPTLHASMCSFRNDREPVFSHEWLQHGGQVFCCWLRNTIFPDFDAFSRFGAEISCFTANMMVGRGEWSVCHHPSTPHPPLIVKKISHGSGQIWGVSKSATKTRKFAFPLLIVFLDICHRPNNNWENRIFLTEISILIGYIAHWEICLN